MAEEPRRGGAWRGVEIALFAVVFVGGGAVAVAGALGESEIERGPAAALVPGPIAAPSPAPGGAPAFPPGGEIPLPEGDIPVGEIPPPAGQFVQITNARADLAPAGCRAHITFLWEIDPATAPPGELEAVITVDGPQKAGQYRRAVVGEEVTLEIEVSAASAGEWTADLETVGGREVFPTPLPVSIADAFC